MEKIIFSAAVIICTIRVVSYGIYAVKDKNKTGAAGIFAMALMAASTLIYLVGK